MGRVLFAQPLAHRPSHHLRHFVAEVLDLSKRRIHRRPLAAKPTGCHRSNAFIKLPPRLARHFNPRSSVLAHASFLPKRASFSKRHPQHTNPSQIPEPKSKTTHHNQKSVPAPVP
jgi:hypothetical protein